MKDHARLKRLIICGSRSQDIHVLIMTQCRVALNLTDKVLHRPAKVAFRQIWKLVARASGTDFHQITLSDSRTNALFRFQEARKVSVIELLLRGGELPGHGSGPPDVAHVVSDFNTSIEKDALSCFHLTIEMIVVAPKRKQVQKRVGSGHDIESKGRVHAALAGENEFHYGVDVVVIKTGTDCLDRLDDSLRSNLVCLAQEANLLLLLDYLQFQQGGDQALDSMARKRLRQPASKLHLLGKRFTEAGRKDSCEGTRFPVKVSGLKKGNIQRVEDRIIGGTKKNVVQEPFGGIGPGHITELPDFRQFSCAFPVRVQADLFFFWVDEDEGIRDLNSRQIQKISLLFEIEV